jgi:hypothetical protein
VAVLLRPRGRLKTAPPSFPRCRRHRPSPVAHAHPSAALRTAFAFANLQQTANIATPAACYIDFTFQDPGNTHLVLLGGQLQVDQNQILRNIMHVRWKFFSITNENPTIR